MKDKIGDILNELYENVQDGEYWDKTMNEITALMCYREVVGMFTAFKEVHSSVNYEAVMAFIVRKLRPVYGEPTVLESIEKYKNEQK